MNVRTRMVKFALLVPVSFLLLPACAKLKQAQPNDPPVCECPVAYPASTTTVHPTADLTDATSDGENPFILTSDDATPTYSIDDSTTTASDPSSAPISAYGDPSAPAEETGTAPWNPAHELLVLSFAAEIGDQLDLSFDAKKVLAYRLVGTEPRVSSSGGLVTALFELVEVSPGSGDPKNPQDLAVVRVNGLEIHVPDSQAQAQGSELEFIAAVASARMIEMSSGYRGAATYTDALAWAQAGRGLDPTGTRQQFIDWLQGQAQPIPHPYYGAYPDNVGPTSCCD